MLDKDKHPQQETKGRLAHLNYGSPPPPPTLPLPPRPPPQRTVYFRVHVQHPPSPTSDVASERGTSCDLDPTSNGRSEDTEVNERRSDNTVSTWKTNPRPRSKLPSSTGPASTVHGSSGETSSTDRTLQTPPVSTPSEGSVARDSTPPRHDDRTHMKPISPALSSEDSHVKPSQPDAAQQVSTQRGKGIAKRKRKSISHAELPVASTDDATIGSAAPPPSKLRERRGASNKHGNEDSGSARPASRSTDKSAPAQKKTLGKPRDHRDHPKRALEPCISGVEYVKAHTTLYSPLGADTVRLPENASFETVELEYPGVKATETFPLVVPSNAEEYDPSKDVRDTAGMIVAHCVPDEDVSVFGDTKSGILRSIRRAVYHKSAVDLKAAVLMWNEQMSLLKERRVFADAEFTGPGASYPMVAHILEQSYARSVAPHSDSLRKYEGFSNNVYGEVRPSFVNTLIQEAGIKPHHIFVDMGSGIGNVVLQVAAQVLCYSYGIEVMDIPAGLAAKQKDEFISRMRYYSKPCGRIKLKHGDFLEDASMHEVIKSADVIFVNK
ncbi:Nucleosomal histone H3-Lys79 methylase [Thoreauomyces humboldtii]|nr:Nucleosomal histone H3-Lys79 methylase [Thoreauomyces humboldtii]